jgi:hypothetical protein
MKINFSHSSGYTVRFGLLAALAFVPSGILAGCSGEKRVEATFAQTTLLFADQKKGEGLQVENDAFKRSTSALARKILAFSETPVSAEQLDPALKALVRVWTPAEIEMQVQSGKEATELARKAGLTLSLPSTVNMVKNNPDLFNGAPYTRGTTIFTPRPLKPSELVHELWHITSRSHHDRLQALYELVGYTPCQAKLTSIGADIRDLILTNPDTEIFGEYCVTLKNDQGAPTRYTPLNYGSDPFDGNLNVALLEVVGDPGDVVVKNNTTVRKSMFDPETFKAYATAIGGNGLSEPIHPDEIIAKSIEARLAIVNGGVKPGDPNGSETNTNPDLLRSIVAAVSAL